MIRCTPKHSPITLALQVDPNARRMHLPPTPGQVLPDWQPCHILACKLQPCRQCLYPRHPTHNARTTPSQGSTAAPVQHDVASAAAPYGQLDPCSQAAHVLFLLDIARKTSNQTLLLAKLWLDTSTAPTFLPPGAATRGPDDHGLGLLVGGARALAECTEPLTQVIGQKDGSMRSPTAEGCVTLATPIHACR